MFRASNTIDSIKKTQRFHGEQLTKVNDNVEVLAEMVRSLASVNEEEKAEPPAPAVDSDEPSSPPVAAPAVAPAFNTPAPVSTTTPEPVATDAIPSAYDSDKKNKNYLPPTPAGFWGPDDDDDDF